MNSTRLRRVVTLAILSLLTLCQTATVAVSVSTGADPQLHGLDTLPYAHPQRRWPSRLLSAFTNSSLGKKFMNSKVGRLFARREASPPAIDIHKQSHDVNRLFEMYDVKKVNARRFFKSSEFKKWRKKAKRAAGDNSEELMFYTMYNKLDARDNGGLEAIIAQGLNDKSTRRLARRFEDRLLRKLAYGVKENKVEDVQKYMRYILYREPDEKSVNLKMDELLGGELIDGKLTYSREGFEKRAGTSSKQLEDYFKRISDKSKIADVFKTLRPVKGFDNNAFLFEKLYDEAARLQEDFAPFMLTQLRKSGWTDDNISIFLSQLNYPKNLSKLREKLLDPMATLLSQSKSSPQSKPLPTGQA